MPRTLTLQTTRPTLLTLCQDLGLRFFAEYTTCIYINLIWSLDLIICDYIIEHISIHRQKRTSHKLLFRLCVWAVLNMKPNASLLVMAVVCSSWSRINVGASRRSILLPEGWRKLQYVTTANSMMSRTRLGIVGISFRVSCFQYPTPLDETNIHGNGINMKLQILNYTNWWWEKISQLSNS